MSQANRRCRKCPARRATLKNLRWNCIVFIYHCVCELWQSNWYIRIDCNSGSGALWHCIPGPLYLSCTIIKTVKKYKTCWRQIDKYPSPQKLAWYCMSSFGKFCPHIGHVSWVKREMYRFWRYISFWVELHFIVYISILTLGNTLFW